MYPSNPMSAGIPERYVKGYKPVCRKDNTVIVSKVEIDYEKKYNELSGKVARMLAENRDKNWRPEELLNKWDDILK